MKTITAAAVSVCLLLLTFGSVQAIALPQQATPTPTRAATQVCAAQHTVAAGDNLYRIGLRYGVAWPAIASANSLANANLVFVGQVLCIPPGGTVTVTPVATAAASATAGPSPTPGRTPTPRPGAATATPTAVPPPAGIPTFNITGSVKDRSVTIQTFNFPAGQSFDVLMGQYGTLGVNGIKVSTVNSGAGGTFTGTFNIPTQLAGAWAIAIRLQSASGYYSYNWFYNANLP